MQRMGQSLGWVVDLAESGEQALASLRSQAGRGTSYQAVFVDWQMPELDGWETSQRIRDLGLAGNPPVVVMVTAHGREMLAQRSPSEQALLDGFLVKPVTASMLLDAVVEARAGVAIPGTARGVTAAGQQRLAGLRLLVVEDNANNQQVARELLEDEGASVQIANHGREAVEAVAAADLPFDVVLMDLQMPVMDGFTATRCIRQDLGLTALPIVAMTANAMASDRDDCLAAGMNDHVGKPFDLDHLVAVLRRQAGLAVALHAMAGTTQDAEATLPPTVRLAAERAQVDIAAALNRLGGKTSVYQRMFRGFVKDLAAMPGELQALVARGETTQASNLLHTLKGLAATVGATALSSVAAHGERQVLGASAADATAAGAPVVAQVCSAIAAAGPQLSELLLALCDASLDAPSLAAPPAPAASEAPKLETNGVTSGTLPVSAAALDALALPAELTKLAALLGDADMAATDAVIELLSRWGKTLGAPGQAMDEAIDELDFERALGLCQTLIDELNETLPA
jgi:CheY-like chemotaxis protein